MGPLNIVSESSWVFFLLFGIFLKWLMSSNCWGAGTQVEANATDLSDLEQHTTGRHSYSWTPDTFDGNLFANCWLLTEVYPVVFCESLCVARPNFNISDTSTWPCQNPWLLWFQKTRWTKSYHTILASSDFCDHNLLGIQLLQVSDP